MKRRDPTPGQQTSRRAAAQLGADIRGYIAVEFAFVLPILGVLWIGGIEVTQAVSINGKVEIMATTATELVAGSPSLTTAELDAVLDLAASALLPHDPDIASLVVSAVRVDEQGLAIVSWSRARGTGKPYPSGAALGRVVEKGESASPGDWIILTEAEYPYQPAVAYVLRDLIALRENQIASVDHTSGVALCATGNGSCR